MAEKGGKGVWDRTLGVNAAAGLMTVHTHRAIAHGAIVGSSDAVLEALRRNGINARA